MYSSPQPLQITDKKFRFLLPDASLCSLSAPWLVVTLLPMYLDSLLPDTSLWPCSASWLVSSLQTFHHHNVNNTKNVLPRIWFPNNCLTFLRFINLSPLSLQSPASFPSQSKFWHLLQTYIFILKTKQLKNYKRIFYPSILIFMGTWTWTWKRTPIISLRLIWTRFKCTKGIPY